ncbi:hypothetical protein Bca4012_005579 [Brassica carinata]|uniref:Uncharacterized protein n=1 Tax=Brassica carinata TaxID=52824 RepID=A0A8X7RSW6_BRACI|nr:hypothetical protein Bca52824_040106 [Brassica carinata]
MPHRTQPLMGLLLFTGINAVLVQTITPVYDFVCFLPYWEKRREGIRQAASLSVATNSTHKATTQASAR